MMGGYHIDSPFECAIDNDGALQVTPDVQRPPIAPSGNNRGQPLPTSTSQEFVSRFRYDSTHLHPLDFSTLSLTYHSAHARYRGSMTSIEAIEAP